MVFLIFLIPKAEQEKHWLKFCKRYITSTPENDWRLELGFEFEFILMFTFSLVQWATATIMILVSRVRRTLCAYYYKTKTQTQTLLTSSHPFVTAGSRIRSHKYSPSLFLIFPFFSNSSTWNSISFFVVFVLPNRFGSTQQSFLFRKSFHVTERWKKENQSMYRVFNSA